MRFVYGFIKKCCYVLIYLLADGLYKWYHKTNTDQRQREVLGWRIWALKMKKMYFQHGNT